MEPGITGGLQGIVSELLAQKIRQETVPGLYLEEKSVFWKTAPKQQVAIQSKSELFNVRTHLYAEVNIGNCFQCKAIMSIFNN